MKAIFSPLRASEQFNNAVNELAEPEGYILADGCVSSQKVHFCFALADAEEVKPHAGVRLILTYSELRAREIAEDCRFYDRNTVQFPAKDLIFYQADLRSREIETERIQCLRQLLEGRGATIVTTYSALMTPQIPLAVLKENILHLSKNETITEETIETKLTAMGYERNFQVDSPGQFAVRGDILDVFDLTQENPCRIEFWGDDITSIRSFDILSQRSIEQLDSVHIYPASEIILSKSRLTEGLAKIRREEEERVASLRKDMKTEEAARLKKNTDECLERAEEMKDYSALESFIRYFYPAAVNFLSLCPRDNTVIFMDEPARIAEHAQAVALEFRESMSERALGGYILPGQMDLLFSEEEVNVQISKYRRAAVCSLSKRDTLFPGHEIHVHARETAPYNNSFDALTSDLKKARQKRERVLILSASRTRARRLAQDLTNADALAFYSEDPERVPAPGEVETCYGHAGHGFEYPTIGFMVIAETDIFGQERKKQKHHHRFEGGEKIRSLQDLKVGDYVVHEDHGIGIYRGIEKIEVNHIAKDYIKIEYGSGDLLYVLPTDLGVLQKYSGGDKASPKLSRLGTQEWNNTRKKVEKAVDEVAQDLVELYAKRQAEQGHVFGPDTPWQREFEEMFPYQETDDQLAAIADVKKDMESPKIMDRLICGDVGYGKTEVALRAAFKAVQDSCQVAVLVPTTILAQQHYNTFTERMRGFPVNIGMLSRFASASEQKKTIKGLADGSCDIVIGTHRLLSKDVKFKNLGLLVIDEEQRFGVAQKEKIKKVRENIDVLTLTATPIPRTLHMSLSGIRDMSILEQAPEDRQPIQTYVMEYNEVMVREAIMRELSRGGQVYYVSNRVNDIDRVTLDLQKMVPEATIAYAHGQMDEKQLEEIMYDFIGRKIDVLVSTTIIETGLDISNVNTMIIQDADRLGLAQLYQLRGRIGRSSRTAYAFLMYKRDRMLREEAEKRLSAIREFTDLGSGYRIAMRDLEIRGAGSVLGKAQHGHMAEVGYDLYCKMLNSAVAKAKGEPVTEEKTCEVRLGVDAYMPETYIVNEAQKLDIYKKISEISSLDDCRDCEDELKDRFGDVPAPAANLLRIALIRSVAEKLDIVSINGYAGKITIKPAPKANVRVANIPAFLNRNRPNLSFVAKGEPVFEYTYRPSGITEKDEEILLATVEKLLSDFSDLLH